MAEGELSFSQVALGTCSVHPPKTPKQATYICTSQTATPAFTLKVYKQRLSKMSMESPAWVSLTFVSETGSILLKTNIRCFHFLVKSIDCCFISLCHVTYQPGHQKKIETTLPLYVWWELAKEKTNLCLKYHTSFRCSQETWVRWPVLKNLGLQDIKDWDLTFETCQLVIK